MAIAFCNSHGILRLILCSVKIGLWPSETCLLKKPGVESGTFQRIFNLTCPAVGDLPDKKLYLRDYNQNFMIGSMATYECVAGYQFPDRVSIMILKLRQIIICPVVYFCVGVKLCVKIS